jgi:hypothetical protein
MRAPTFLNPVFGGPLTTEQPFIKMVEFDVFARQIRERCEATENPLASAIEVAAALAALIPHPLLEAPFTYTLDMRKYEVLIRPGSKITKEKH